VEWDEDFSGQASLKVMATNNCGSSIWSDSLEITVTNTTGIGDLEQSIGVDIYPNPNHGIFTLALSTEKAMYINVYIFSSNNTLVYQLDNLKLSGSYNEQIDLSNFASGMYTLSIESKDGKLSRQVILGD